MKFNIIAYHLTFNRIMLTLQNNKSKLIFDLFFNGIFSIDEIENFEEWLKNNTIKIKLNKIIEEMEKIKNGNS